MAWVNVNDIVYPVGHVVMTSTNESPANSLGGTWTCVNKVFKDLGNTVTTTLGSYASSFTCYVLRAGNTIRMRIYFIPNVTIADTAYHMGTIDLTSLGVNSLGYAQYYQPAGSDAANGYAMCLVHSSGKVETVEAVGKTSGSLPTGGGFYLEFSQVCYPSQMLDDACKAWFWKRTA